MDNGWDEAHEPAGWGEDANSTLLDAVDAGLPALLRYAGDVEGWTAPTGAQLVALLDEADSEARALDVVERLLAALDAVERLRAALDATAVLPEAA